MERIDQPIAIQESPSPEGLDQEALRRTLPDSPGVYLFKDGADQVIYVGKAKNLRKRVLSYLKPPSDLSHKTALMMGRARHLEYILTATENEAFILESNLIRKWMPRYNIILRDDKQFLSLRLDPREPYPRLTLVRRIKKDGARYFGPFSSALSVRNTLRLIDRTFRLRKCKGSELPKRTRPCLNYQLQRCLGACVDPVPESVYRETVEQVVLFLEGRNKELLRHLQSRMEDASAALNFEEAARIRDQIRAVGRVMERQHVVSPRLEDEDVIGLAQGESASQLALLYIRKGRLSGSRDYRFENRGGSDSEVMEAFLKQYYNGSPFVPKTILVSAPVEDMPSIAEWLSEQAGKRVRIEHPQRGQKRSLVDMAVANAQELLSRVKAPEGEDLMELARKTLRLSALPRRIEGMDISNIGGQMAVGATVSFEDALPRKDGYRSYRIREIEGIDDYGMMGEVVARRLEMGHPPDLFLVDGGRGHLNAVKRVIDRSGFAGKVEVVSIAKEDQNRGGDKIYIPGRKNPLPLDPDHPVLLLLMRIRDEAHRRAVTHHRKLRGRELRNSDLDRIPGLGPLRKEVLLRHFGDVIGVSRASMQDLESLPGIGPVLAKDIAAFLGGL
jgi:excinuclease ABC subunit C